MKKIVIIGLISCVVCTSYAMGGRRGRRRAAPQRMDAGPAQAPVYGRPAMLFQTLVKTLAK